MIEYQSKSQEDLPGTKPTIAVVGIGGAGANVLDRIALEGLTDAELISMNSDVRALANSVAPTKIQLGKMLTQGLGAGGDPELGREAAQASMEEIRDVLRGKDLVFLCSGQGGGIGSGAAPLVAQAAKEQGAFVVVFATMPFCFEGKRRLAQARQSLEMYRGVADALITFDNDRMGELILPKEGIQQAFGAADQIISQSIRAVTSLVTQPGLIHIGMDDLISALRNNDSRCLFGYGAAKGQNRAQEALKRALKSPLLDKGKLLEKSKNLLVHISGGETMTLYEVELLMNALEKHVPESTQILFGASSDKALGDSLSVTLISSLAAVEMSGEASVQGGAGAEYGHPQPQHQMEAQYPAAAVSASSSAVNLAGGDSIIRTAPVTQQPMVQQPALQQPVAQQPQVQRPLADVSAQVVQRRPEIVEPPLTPPPPTYQQPQPQVQPVYYAQPSAQQGQPSQASGLGKSFESIQAASAAVESAPVSPAQVSSDDADSGEPEKVAPVSLAAAAAAVAAGTLKEVPIQAKAGSELTESESSDDSSVPSISIGAVPAPDSLEESAMAGAAEGIGEEAATSGERPEPTVVEVKIPTAAQEEDLREQSAEIEEEVAVETEEWVQAQEDIEAEIEVEAEAEAEVEVETEDEVEAEVEAEAEAEVETEDEVEAESESESEEVVEAALEEDVEADKDDDVESREEEETTKPEVKPVTTRAPQTPVLVQAKGSPQTVVLKPVVRQNLAPAAKVAESDSTKSREVADRPPQAVDMASALAEEEKRLRAESSPEEYTDEPEPMGTMGPAAALGLKAVQESSGPSLDSVGRPTVTAGDPRTGKQQMLELEPVAKGRFDKAEPTVVDGEDLDIPTFLRKKGNYT